MQILGCKYLLRRTAIRLGTVENNKSQAVPRFEPGTAYDLTKKL
jgi:hypothetical protein